MPFAKMNCKQCGREFYVFEAIQRVFCSPECRYLNRKGLPPNSLDNAARIRAPEKGTQKVEEDARLAWQRAGRTFEAISKRALGRELETKSQQSVIISGSGANLSVRNDALQIKHGMLYAPQEVLAEKFNRAVHSLKRIVWCAATGNISFAALKWCHEQGIINVHSINGQ